MSKLKNPFLAFKDKLKRTAKKPSKTTQGVRVNRSVTSRAKAHKDTRARKRAEYLATLPKNPVKRFLYRMHPKRLAKFWFSRDGAILALKIIGIGFAVLMIMTLSVFAYYRKDLPKNITDLKTCSQGASTTYYDRTGQTLLWASSGDVECYPVKFDNISPYLRNSVIASEDKDFYKHGGFSASGVLRAGINNLRGGDTQGGSTITQQFVKNSLLTQEQRISRKIKELILSIELERSYSKNEILNAYLNEIPFGSTYDGAEAASRGYFNKSAKDLTLDEAALLTAIIPAPSYYSPTGNHTDKLLLRQHYVLDLMVQQGYIKKDEAEAAKKVDTLAKVVATKNKYKDILAPYFVTEAETRLEGEYGSLNLRKYGYKVTTTVDLKLQKYAEDAVANGISRIVRDGGDNAALVAVEAQTGQVLAMVGGRGFDYPVYGQVNYATTPRSPGSTFKPYDYASLMTKSKDWGPGSTLYDVNTDFGYGYKPKDYDFKEPGALSMRLAIGGSRNTPALKAMYMAGIQYVHDTAKKMGLKSGITGCYTPGVEDCGEILSTGIGDGGQIRLDEHVNAFGTFARMGVYKPITYVLKVEDSRGKVLKEWKDTAGERVLDEQVAYSINSITSDGSARYIGLDGQVRINGVTTAVKTGTTNNSDNGWLMGYNTKIVAGVWIGNHENKVLRGFMEQKTAPIWREFFAKANEGLPGAGDKWVKPAGIKTVCIDTVTGYATTNGGKCDIFPSWYTPQYPDNSKKAVIDSVSKKLATECTPDAAKQTITGGGIRSELPTSDPLYNNWIKPVQARYGAGGGAIPTEKDDVHTCDPADKPTITLITTPDGAGKYLISAEVAQGKNPLTTVNFKVNGTIIDGGSVSITSSGTTTPISYTVVGTDPVNMTAQVIDSVLYDVTTEPKSLAP